MKKKIKKIFFLFFFFIFGKFLWKKNFLERHQKQPPPPPSPKTLCGCQKMSKSTMTPCVILPQSLTNNLQS